MQRFICVLVIALASCATLQDAVSNRDMSKAQNMIRSGGNVNERRSGGGDTPLTIALKNRDLPMVTMLLENGADPNVNDTASGGYSPLYLSIGLDVNAHDQLIAKGANLNFVDESGRSLLHLAACFNNVPAVKVLLARGIPVNKTANDGAAPLHDAARFPSLDSVRALVEAGADVNAVDSEGFTPLHLMVAQSGKSRISTGIALFAVMGMVQKRLKIDNGDDARAAAARYLVGRGANLRTKNKDGESPLHSALFTGKKNTALALMDSNADLKSLDSKGNTPLITGFIFSVFTQDREVLKRLIAESEVNHQNSNGFSPLHFSVLLADPEIVKLLLARGANRAAKNNEGQTPRDLAVKNGNQQIAELLKE